MKKFNNIGEVKQHYQTLATSASFKKVAVYMLVESEETLEQDVAEQREALYTFCARNHLDPVLECGEVCAESGIYSNLEGFQHLIERTQKDCTWDFILVTDFARIATDDTELAKLKGELSGYGVMLLDLNSTAQLKGFLKVERMIKNRFKI